MKTFVRNIAFFDNYKKFFHLEISFFGTSKRNFFVQKIGFFQVSIKHFSVWVSVGNLCV